MCHPFLCGARPVTTGQVGFCLVPTGLLSRVVSRRPLLDELEVRRLPVTPPRAWEVDSLVQIHLRADDPPSGFAQGRTMRNSLSTRQLQYREQQITQTPERLQVITRFDHPAGLICDHILTYTAGEERVQVMVQVHNTSTKPVMVEMLTSFSLDGISPFASDDAPERLMLHQIRSAWSAEGRLTSTPIENLHLERSWTGNSVACERFGQVGTMPVRGLAPFAALEDTAAGVVWGAQLAWAGSWQIEVYRRTDTLALSGGLADREFGHWSKLLEAGAVFTTPAAYLTVVQGDVDACCQRLQKEAARSYPLAEANLPIVANEYCGSWGKPTHDALVALADCLQGTPVRYLVIDAGWYASQRGQCSLDHGDWLPSSSAFPQGLAATAAAIRKRGLIPGLWFEIETCGQESAAFGQTAHLLHRDGYPITVGGRRFWDFRDPFVVAYLEERVIDLLEQCG